MKKILFILLLFPCLSFAQIGGGRSAKYVDFDSGGVAADSSFRYGKLRVFAKQGTDNILHLYGTRGNGSTFRIDSLDGSGSGTSKRIAPYAWYNWSAVADSQIVFESDTTFTIDSIRVIMAGASAISTNFKRIRSGTPVDLLSANYAVTTSMTTASGLQNNTIQRNDQIWACLRSITGTATYYFIQVCYH